MTFGRRIGISFTICFLLLVGIGWVSYSCVNQLTENSYRVRNSNNVLERLASFYSMLKDAETGQRGYVLTGEDPYLAPYEAALTTLPRLLSDLREGTRSSTNHQQRLSEVQPLMEAKLAELANTIELRRNQGFEAALKVVRTGAGKKSMDDMRRLLDEMDREEREALKKRADEVEQAATTARSTVLWGTIVCVVLVSSMGIALTRSLTNQIGSAVQRVRSSSAELQTAANQQVMGSRESSTSMNEVATTISELLVTSRQIAESAVRVAGIAEQTANSARGGDGTVRGANESIAGIRRQMDQVVTHMLDLGKKSQQIGSVLEIVSELAEQTNILAINATIEAAGAGEAGKRFAVVADEIRKLADRVGGSAKEIRGLIEEVRSAVNTTVMSTETGSKAVDAGNRQIGEVTAAFQQIAALVSTTTEAAREIELSTKQQATAVEQVNVAIANVAQSARETEASSTQTLQTASELTNLSEELLRLVRPSLE